MDDDNSDASPMSPLPRRYSNEDTSATTTTELRGWYCYGMAAEVFAVVGTGSFLPVTMEQLARESGVLFSDRNTPCTASTSSTSREKRTEDQDQCLITLLGAEITSSSFVMYTFSLAVFVQALTLVSFSTFADHGNNRKRLLLFFAWTGAATAMCFILVTPAILPLGSLLAIVSITCLGSSFVMLNSFLPLLTANHPSVRSRTKHHVDRDSTHTSSNEVLSPAAKLSNSISARGVALGYGTAVFVQIIAIVILIISSRTTASKTLPLRSILFLTGAWWAIFTLPTCLFLRHRPGPPLPSSKSTNPSSLHHYLTYPLIAWKSLYQTLRLALTLRQLRLFLLAWFLISDAVATTGTVAILFARTTLGLSPAGIALLSITATVSGIAGSLSWPRISTYYNLPTNRTIRACTLLMLLVPLYGLLAYLPPIRALGFLGLQQPWEIYPLAIIYGFAQGGLSSYARSFYGQLIPPGQEAMFYALMAITDKGSSAIGPAIVGAITDKTGSIRPAFLFLFVLIALPAGIVGFVDEERGKMEAEAVEGRQGAGSASEMEMDLRDEAGEALMRGHIGVSED